VIASLVALALASGPGLALREARSAIFAGEPWSVTVDASDDRTVDAQLAWKLVVSGRVVDRGERRLQFAAGAAASVELIVRVPPVDDGVALPALFVASLVERDEPAATVEARLWIFGKDPFVGRREMLRDLRLRLFDPDGATRRVFESMRLPFEQLDDAASLDRLEVGTLVIGEGVDLARAGLSRGVASCLDRGIVVVILAPRAGRLDLPRAESVRACGRSIVAEVDARLEARGWLAGGTAASRTLRVCGDERGLALEAATSADGWSWCEASFGPGRGRLIACSLALVDGFESGPSPRQFLAGLLARLNEVNR
jgi:hypothetical protein